MADDIYGPPSPLDERLPQSSGALDRALGSPGDPADFGRLGQNIQRLETAEGQRAPSPLDMLTSPEGLIKLGLGAAGLLSGNADMQALGGGLAMGAITGAPERSADLFAQHQKVVQDLSKQVMQQQQQIVDLLRSQPNLFVDEDGNNMYNTEQWETMLGGISVNPVKQLQETLGVKRERIDFLVKSAANAAANGRAQAARTIGRRVANELDLDFTNEELDAAFMAPDDTTFMKVLLPKSTYSSIQAVIRAVQDNPGTTYSDHVWLLQQQKDELTPSQRVTNLELEALDLVQQVYERLTEEERAYYALPENVPELYRIALKDRSDLQTIVKDKFEDTSGYNLFKDVTLAQFNTMMQSASFKTQFELYGAQTQVERLRIMGNYLLEINAIRDQLLRTHGSRQEALRLKAMTDAQLAEVWYAEQAKKLGIAEDDTTATE